MQPLEEAELSGRSALVVAVQDELAGAIRAGLEARGARVLGPEVWPAGLDTPLDVLVLVDREADGFSLGSLEEVRGALGPVLEGMGRRGWGRVLILSPSAGGSPHRRAGLFGLVRSTALEVGAAGITVNGLDLGILEAETRDEQALADLRRRTPRGQALSVNEVAEGVGFLASPRAAYITGVVLPLNGGLGLGLYPEQFIGSR